MARLEELGPLELPEVRADLIEAVHEGPDVGLVKAAAEVAGGGGVGNPLGAQGVKEDFVLPQGSRSWRHSPPARML